MILSPELVDWIILGVLGGGGSFLIHATTRLLARIDHVIVLTERLQERHEALTRRVGMIEFTIRRQNHGDSHTGPDV